ncbi:hypothetical protein WJX75_004794 [Coccomyxa subellipsoidea]|uniref:Bacterial surface antigen (D15) domain-containing protein n=1 Tax=Coccomyxa subellipsoidea TaxID=248742 RepID=A0ABR2YY07_9CHLO
MKFSIIFNDIHAEKMGFLAALTLIPALEKTQSSTAFLKGGGGQGTSALDGEVITGDYIGAVVGVRIATPFFGTGFNLCIVQPSEVPDFGLRYGIQIGQAFGYDFGIGIIRDICFVSFVIV